MDEMNMIDFRVNNATQLGTPELSPVLPSQHASCYE